MALKIHSNVDARLSSKRTLKISKEDTQTKDCFWSQYKIKKLITDSNANSNCSIADKPMKVNSNPFICKVSYLKKNFGMARQTRKYMVRMSIFFVNPSVLRLTCPRPCELCQRFTLSNCKQFPLTTTTNNSSRCSCRTRPGSV